MFEIYIEINSFELIVNELEANMNMVKVPKALA